MKAIWEVASRNRHMDRQMSAIIEKQQYPLHTGTFPARPLANYNKFGNFLIMIYVLSYTSSYKNDMI